jgi:hypothetical protein
MLIMLGRLGKEYMGNLGAIFATFQMSKIISELKSALPVWASLI